MKTLGQAGKHGALSDSEQWFYGLGGRSDGSKKNEVAPSWDVHQKNMRSWRKKSLYEEALGCFNIYKRQGEALAKCESGGSQLRIFAYEHSIYHPGQRRFLVTTAERFWHWYKKQKGVSFYEVIQQNCPCRLYFDCEFYRNSNPNTNISEVVKAFETCVEETFKKVFGMALESDKHFLVLDASTETKFSEHIIVHLPGDRLFSSNTAIKPFFESVVAMMRSTESGLVWNRDRTKRVPLCDAAVYSTNRNFRLYLSSKLTKNNPLHLSARCNFYSENKVVSHRQIFMDSLIIPASQFDKTLKGKNADTKDKLEEIVLPMLSKAPATHFEEAVIDGHGLTSPYPVLEQHILSINKKWKENVSIRSWKMLKGKNTSQRQILYYLSGCRYCFNIGREHKSNGVYWIVDLCKLWCYQKCFDVDCQGTSSNFFPLPEFVSKSIPTAADVADALSQGKIRLLKNKTAEESEKPYTSEFVNELVMEMKMANNEELNKRLVKLRRRSANIEARVWCRNGVDDDLSDEELIKIALEDRGTNN